MNEPTADELRELDAWIAEYVMGWKFITKCTFPTGDIEGVPPTTSGLHHAIPRYTADPAAAMMVLEKCIKKLGELDSYFSITDEGEDGVSILWKNEAFIAPTLEIAICRFAKAMFEK